LVQNTGLVILLSLFSPPARGASSYTTSVTSVTTLTISAATSGMVGARYGVYLVDSNNVKRPTSEYSGTIDPSTYSVTIAFDPPFTGTVTLKGLFSGSDTTHGYDFKFTAPENGTVRVCDGCVDTSTGYAKRTASGKHYVSTRMAEATFDMNGQYCNGGLVIGYILDNQLYFGDPFGCITSVTNAKVSAASSYPTDSVPLGSVRNYYGLWDSLTDDRPF